MTIFLFYLLIFLFYLIYEFLFDFILRFILWDLEPLDEVKENLDRLTASTGASKMNIVDKVSEE